MQDYKFDKLGYITGIVQDHKTKEVLMVAMLNEEAIETTLETGYAHFWSRSRNKLWFKGETSGNTLKIMEIKIDCDSDAMLFMVEPNGPACHTGEISCFFRKVAPTNDKQIIKNN